jgi:hypothetical protein
MLAVLVPVGSQPSAAHGRQPDPRQEARKKSREYAPNTVRRMPNLG